MFFNYNIFRENTNERVMLCDARINIENIDNSFIHEYAKKVCSNAKNGKKCVTINVRLGIPDKLKIKLESISGEKYLFNEEAYCIEIGENTNIYAESENGIIYALTTLKNLAENDDLKESFIYDKPYIKKRGLHSFIPGRSIIKDFKQMIDDLLVNYKYNTIILEIGGGMEYKKHPKINTEWEKYCSVLLEKSGIADSVQHYTYPWSKNAIHPENGCGSYLTQEELKDLVKYCNDRGIEIIPEIPSLSHSDYIVRAYPELNERVEDMDPDTYCPSNPKTYEIMFDIIDEVMEVFDNPKYISIGHDEVVTIGVCGKCKDKEPTDIFIEDIKKLSDYIEKKGSKVIMYGDKFCPLRKDDGSPYIDEKGKLCGGLQGYEKGDLRYVPELYKAYEKLPESIIIADWYWDFNFDYVFSDREVWFMNFHGMRIRDWKGRTEKNVKGVFASNWGRCDYPNMLRNGVIQSIMYNAYICWNKNYEFSDRLEIMKKTLKELHNYYINSILKYSPDKKYIVVNHTTDYHIPHKLFLDGSFINEEEYRIGDYMIKYKDGTSHREKVIYGKNISNIDINTNVYSSDLSEVSSVTVANKYEGKTYYRWIFENPFADKEIEDISFERIEGFDNNVYIESIV